MKIHQFVLFILMMPIMSFTQILECDDRGGGYYRVTAESGLNLRKAPNSNSEKLIGIPFRSEVYCCNSCESSPNELIEGIKGCWKKVYFEDFEGYVFSGFLEAAPKIEIMCPVDWMTHWENPVFDEDTEYFGIYDTDGFGRESKVRKIEGKDTMVYSIAMGKIRKINFEGRMYSLLFFVRTKKR